MVLYSFGLALALAVSAPWWLWRMATSGRYRAGLSARLGVLPASLDETRAARGAARGLIWLHAVSVGEVLAAERLISELRVALPGLLVVVSATTAAGYKVAGEKLGVPVFYFPLDFAFAVRRYLRALRPSLFVTMESELWPRVLVECERGGVPVAVVNARVSDRSFPRYMGLRWLWRPLLAKVRVFLAQGEETAGRLRAIGVASDHVRVLGNLKYDVVEKEPSKLVERLKALFAGKRVIVAGSTLNGEEKLILAAYAQLRETAPDTVLVIAPRHSQRFDAVGRTILAANLPWFRASILKAGDEVGFEAGGVLLLDTIGDLTQLYALADVAFLGGSLVSRGGHNPLEAARFGIPVVMGPSYENFREIVTGMLAAGAIRISDVDRLAENLREELAGSHVGAAGEVYFESQQGATGRTVEALVELIR